MTKKNENKKTVAEIITQRFIDALEGGKVPWVRPWEMWTSWSRATGNDYRGANQLTLSGGEYVTFKQAKDQGISIKKGAKSEMIVKYTDYKRTVTEEEAAQMVAEFKISPKQIEHMENGKCKVPARSIKYYNVFNVETCTDAEQKLYKKQKRHEWEAIDEAERIAADYIQREGLKVTEASNQPCYKPGLHEIESGRKEQFATPERYYSTLFHEMIHSTMKTLKRDASAYHASPKARAREELVAEIGAAYIMSYLGIESSFTVMNSNEYVRGWAENLKSDPNAILWAAPKAIEAANLILNIQ
jgi:antirestriction protein ArdC